MSIGEKLAAIAANVPKVYAAGKAQAEDLWDSLQERGSRTDYHYGFAGTWWTDENFKPKYPICPTRIAYMFHGSRITDLSAGQVDFSRITGNVNNARPFANSAVKRVGVVDLSNMREQHNTFFGVESGTSALESVELLKLPTSGVNIFGPNFFQNCSKLESISFSGLICGDLNMSACPLSADSVRSVIDCLHSTGTQRTLRLSDTAKSHLTQDQRDTAAAKNWTIV